MIENTNTKQFYPGPILNNTLEITDFLFNDAEQIKIKHSKLNEEGILIDVDLNYPTDYEVTKVLPSDINAAEAALTASTGQIMLKNVNVLAGEKLTVYRVSLIIQDKDYPRTGAFPAATHEGALDYLTMQNQEQKDEIDRALKVPISTQNFEGSLPLPIPSRALKINNDGTGFEMSEFDPDLALVTTEEFKNQSQQAAAEALASQNAATEQATIAAQQANIATEKTIEVAQAKEEAVTTIKDVETSSLIKINSEFNKANEWYERLNAIPYIPVGTILPTTGAIDESLGYQRYANGQLIANVSSQAPDLVKFLEFQEAHAPNLLCAETEWQTALTLSTLGQVGKYVWNKEEDSIRIPRIVNIQGMMDMNTIGNMIEAGLLNITGSQSFGTWRNNQFESAGLVKGSSGCVAPASKELLAGGNSIEGFDLNTNTLDTFHIDASRSSAVYGKSNTVQEESILYPYVLQIATGVQYKTPVINEIELNNPYSFGDSKYSPKPLNNLSWLKSEGQWNSKAVYPSYYDWALTNFNNGVEGFALSTGEYTDYDVVINTADETFRLPLLDGSEDLPSDKIEDLPIVDNQKYEAEYNGKIYLQGWGTATNGWANITIYDKDNRVIAGYNTVSPTTGHGVMQTIFIRKGQFWKLNYLNFDVRELHFIYAQGNGSLYFYVGETVQNANLINAGRIEETLATKTDKVQASLASMPSNRYIDLTLGASATTYTAPANGYFSIEAKSTVSNGAVNLLNKKNNLFISSRSSLAGPTIGAYVNAMAGDEILIGYDGSLVVYHFRFIYAEGSY